jgi:hypothetical protein
MSGLRLIRDGSITAPGRAEIDFRTPDYSVWLTIKADSDRDAEAVASALQAAFGEAAQETQPGDQR